MSVDVLPKEQELAAPSFWKRWWRSMVDAIALALALGAQLLIPVKGSGRYVLGAFGLAIVLSLFSFYRKPLERLISGARPASLSGESRASLGWPVGAALVVSVAAAALAETMPLSVVPVALWVASMVLFLAGFIREREHSPATGWRRAFRRKPSIPTAEAIPDDAPAVALSEPLPDQAMERPARPEKHGLRFRRTKHPVSGAARQARAKALPEGNRRFLKGGVLLEIALVLSIVAIGFGLRAWNLEAYPSGMHGDEGEMGMEALSILSGTPHALFGTGWLRHPSLFFFLQAGSMWLFGSTLAGLRMLSAIAGTLTLIPFYLLVRYLFKARTALIATALLAVSYVHVHFSRMALNNVETPLFWVICLYFLVRGFRTRRLAPFAWSGLAGGFSLYFYFGSRLLPALIVALVVILAVIRRGFLRTYYRHLLVMFLGAWIAFAPLGVYFLQHQDEFMERTSSIYALNNLTRLEDRYHAADEARLLWEQAKATFLVFNQRPDDSSFLSFTQAPVLDPLVGALFILGLAYGAFRWRDARYLVCSVWFWMTLLVGGILTIDSPYVPRLVGAVPVLFVFPALALNRVVENATRWLGRRAAVYASLGLLAVVAVSGFLNDGAYFGSYARAYPWADVTTQARYIAGLGPTFKAYVVGTPYIYFDHGDTRFLARDVEGASLSNPTDYLPDLSAQPKSIAFLVYPALEDYLPVIKYYYPAGTATDITDGAGRHVFTSYVVTADQIAASHSLDVTYYAGTGGSTVKQAEGTSAGLEFRPPADLNLSYPVTVSWDGSIFAAVTGSYSFQLRAGGGGSIELDGKHLVRAGPDGEAATAAIRLARGLHRISVTVQIPSAASPMSLEWTTPDGSRGPIESRYLFASKDAYGLVGQIFSPGKEVDGPIAERIDPVIGFREASALSPTRQPFTARWTGQLVAPRTGPYLLETLSGGQAKVFVDGELVVDNQQDSSSQDQAKGRIDLFAGPHVLSIEYTLKQMPGALELYWTPPGGERALVPPQALLPSGEKQGDAAGHTITLPPATRVSVGPVSVISNGLKEPRGVVQDHAGNLYVADTGDKTVVKFDAGGKRVEGWAPGGVTLTEPFDLAVDGQDNLYVLDASTSYIHEFSPNGRLIGSYGGPKMGFFHPHGIAVGPDGDLYVADTGSNRVVKLGPQGQLLAHFGQESIPPGALNQPIDVALDKDGNIFVVDLDKRVVEFNYNGVYQVEWPVAVGVVSGGSHLDIAPDGRIYVTEPEQGQVLAFERDGTDAQLLGGPGAEPGQFGLPVGVYISPDGLIFVSESGNNRVQVFKR